MKDPRTSYRCQFCRRALTDPESINRGVGPECAAKKAQVYGTVGTTDAEIEKIAEYDERAAQCIKNALRFGKPKDLAWAKSKIERVRISMAARPVTENAATVII